MINTLKELCALPGVSGDEEAVREYILDLIGDFADEVVTDVMGNVIVLKKGAKTPAKKVVLCAHMDEVGVIVTGITDDGYLRFAMAGAIDSRVVVGKTVTVGKQRVIGVIGCKAIHLLKEKDREKNMETDDMYIDIGAKNREAAEKLVSLGDTGAFSAEIRGFGDGFIKAKAIDDRFGCAVLIELIKSDLPVDCQFTFSVQEEVGMRGALTAAYRTAPDFALIIEGTAAADIPSVPENKKVCKVGKGVVIPFMDQGTIYNRELYSMLTGIADKNGIPWQTKNVVAGATDAAAFQRSRAGVKTAGIAAPVRNLHSPACVAKTSDLEEVYKLAGLFLEEIGAMY
jgi:endoglucanase